MQVRAFAGWPTAHHTFLVQTPGKADAQQPLQILRSACCQDLTLDPGADPHAVHVMAGRLVIACRGGGLLELLQVQPCCGALVLLKLKCIASMRATTASCAAVCACSPCLASSMSEYGGVMHAGAAAQQGQHACQELCKWPARQEPALAGNPFSIERGSVSGVLTDRQQTAGPC